MITAEPTGSHDATRRVAVAWVARVVAEVCAPAPVMTVLLLAVILHSAHSAPDVLMWALLAGVFTVLVPVGYVLLGVRRRRLSDHHVSVRQQRPVPMLVGVISALAGLGVLGISGASRELLAMIAGMTLMGLAALAVTFFWKISVHTAVVAGAVSIATLLFGPGVLGLLALVPLVGWARIEVRAHTPPQVLGGAVLGAGLASMSFALLR